MKKSTVQSNTQTETDNAQNAPYTESLTETAHHAIDRASEKAAMAEQSIGRAATNTQAHASELAAKAQQGSQQTVSNLKTYAREHPLESAGIAFVSGFLVAKLLQR